MKVLIFGKVLVAFIKRFKGIFLLSVLLGVLAFIVLKVMLPRFFGGTIETYGLAGKFHTDELPHEITDKISLGLTKAEEDGEISGSLAESWSEEDSGKTWIFKLKQGQKWQDGTEITAASVSYNFQDVEVERPDDYTIIFKLNSPFAPFPSIVTHPVFKKGLLGSGEWKVTKLSLKGSFVEKVELKNKKGDQKIYKFYPTEESAKTAFKLGSVDILEHYLDPTPFDTWATATVKGVSDPQSYVAIFFNNQDDKLRGSERKTLRQALSYAINKKVLGGERALGPISPNSWAYNAQVKDYAYDVDRAKSLLGIENKEELKENIELTTTSALLPVAEKIAADWAEVGVDTQIKVSSGVPEEYQAFLAIYNIPEDPDQYSTWHSTQVGVNNIAFYQNQRIDKLLEDGRLEIDQEKRKKIYLDFQRFLLEDAPAVFLYHPEIYTITRK